MQDNPYLTMAEVAAAKRISLPTLGRRIRAGKAPPSSFIGKHRVFHRADVAGWEP
jgi:predicted DNA-binding transcriptional regulator AlpA